MPEINFKYDDSSFTDVVKRKTQNVKDNTLCYYTIYECATHPLESPEELFRNLKMELKPIVNKDDRIVFISELLLHLGEARKEIDGELDSEPRTIELLDDIVHFLFRELEKLKVGIDKNAFSITEIKTLRSKIELIITKLERIDAGQEIVFERIEELTEDYKNLMASFGLGKKPFFQRFAGVLAAYIGEKGADEIYEILKPYIKDIAQGTKLIAG